MGQLLTFLNGGKESLNIWVDLENAKPSPEEAGTYEEVQAVLAKSGQILTELQEYTGCEKFIREAMSNTTPEAEEHAWTAVLPAVEQLKKFYDFSNDLQTIFPKLLNSLCKDNPKDALQHQQATAKQVANVLDFVLRFDNLKMMNPAIQNDFSYYRRSLNRLKMTKQDSKLTIRDELANRMSLFFAYPTPMMNVINDVTSKFMNEHAALKDNVVNGLGIFANICQEMIEKKKFDNEATNMFCLRAMVGCVILFDHLHPQGAFHKKSPVRIKECITALKNFKPGAGSTDGLLNALRFTTMHLNDADTPANVRALLE